VSYAHILTQDEKRELLRIARSTLREYLASGTIPPGAPHCKSLTETAGAFVTLHKGSELRGCIGSFAESAPLYRAVQEMTVGAATRDPRFTPVCDAELSAVEIEISVLSGLRPVTPPGSIVIGMHGLQVTCNFLRGVLLPQVAVEHGWSALEFLEQTCRKAGLPKESWRDPATIVEIFEAQVFADREFPVQ
jgi:AmmeMemoRadiSam system protein A